jgi:hypothetical protein
MGIRALSPVWGSGRGVVDLSDAGLTASTDQPDHAALLDLLRQPLGDQQIDVAEHLGETEIELDARQVGPQVVDQRGREIEPSGDPLRDSLLAASSGSCALPPAL